MRRTLFTLTLGSLLALGLPAASLAQDNPQAQEGGRHGGQGRMNPDRQLERMTRELGLSTDQQAQIRPLLVDRQRALDAEVDVKIQAGEQHGVGVTVVLVVATGGS